MLALLYDVHGNLPALEAVLADARAAGADRWLLGGDYAFGGAWPAEAVARLRALDDARWLRGNGDRWLVDDGDVPDGSPAVDALAAARAALGGELVGALGALPERATLDEGLFCHASPLDDMHSFGPEPGPEDERLLDGARAARVVFGHTHLAFRRLGPGGVELVNPGSVGMPLDGDPRAAYALVGDDGRIAQRRVAYDHEAAAQAIVDRFGAAPWTEAFAQRVRGARPD
jgi:diadenosine tetraphosphatase ApaH/serine/threonine PP2A family protein phosphatase